MKRVEYQPLEVSDLIACEIIERIRADPTFPERRTVAARSAVRQVCRWAGKEPASVPFTARTMRHLMDQLSPGAAGVTKKTMQNAFSLVELVLRHFGLEGTSQFGGRLAPAYADWFARITKYERAGLSRFFRFLSARQRALADVSDIDMTAFFDALLSELPEKQARTIHANAIRAWNRLKINYAEWPGKHLSRPLKRVNWAYSWHEFSPSLKVAAEAMFSARANKPTGLFEEGSEKRSLAATTVRNRMEHLRIGASHVCRELGINPGDLVDLSEVCRPERFRLIVEAVASRQKDKITPYVEQVAVTLHQTASECGLLTDVEIEEVGSLRYKVYRRRLDDCAADVNSDQAVLNMLDEPGRMDTLLALPAKTFALVQKRGRRDRVAAYRVQKAMALELWFACALRVTNFSMLRDDEHIHYITIGKTRRLAVRLPGAMTKNGKPLEFYLHDAAADLLETYLKVYRPLIAPEGTAWLFPGRDGRHKHPHVLAKQMKEFIWKGVGIRFHPHLIRKIVTKLILDHNPSNIETARILLGHADTRTTRAAYVQAQNRAAQEMYAKALEQRRLGAMKRVDGRTDQKATMKKLRAGKGKRVQQGERS